MRAITTFILFLGFPNLHGQSEDLNDFDRWDTNKDGYITDTEFEASWDGEDYYATWDVDGSGVVSRDEWQRGVDTYYSDVNDQDINVSRDYNEWDMDRDGIIGEDELRQGNYNAWDADRDGRLDDLEYSNYTNFSDIEDYRD